MAESLHHPDWGLLTAGRPAGSLHVEVEVNRVPIQVILTPPADAPLVAYLREAWETFLLLMERIETALHHAGQALLARHIEAWGENELDIGWDRIERSFTIDAVHFSPDGGFTLCFASDLAPAGDLVSLEGTREGRFTAVRI